MASKILADSLRRHSGRLAISDLPAEVREHVLQQLTSVHDVIAAAGSSGSIRAAARSHVLWPLATLDGWLCVCSPSKNLCHTLELSKPTESDALGSSKNTQSDALGSSKNTQSDALGQILSQFMCEAERSCS
jgi:hypothetical protein